MDLFVDILVSWAPMIILIGVWIYFMKKIKHPQKQTIEYMEKQNKLIAQTVEYNERIAIALEKLSDNAINAK